GQLITLQNFTGTINTSGPGLVLHSATQIATLDPTAFALADRSLMDFTGGISALVQGRLAGADANGRPPTGASAVAYTPDDRKLIGRAPPGATPRLTWCGPKASAAPAPRRRPTSCCVRPPPPGAASSASTGKYAVTSAAICCSAPSWAAAPT